MDEAFVAGFRDEMEKIAVGAPPSKAGPSAMKRYGPGLRLGGKAAVLGLAGYGGYKLLGGGTKKKQQQRADS